MTIIENRTYTPADPEWTAVIDELREGDEVEAWFGNRGARGALDDDLSVGDEPRLYMEHDLASLTVTKLAPREPSWAGARVVLDRDGDPWRLRRDTFYVTRGGVETAATLEKVHGPITILLDANGHIPPNSVLSVNGVTREDLVGATHDALGYVSWKESERAVDAILAALGGAR